MAMTDFAEVRLLPVLKKCGLSAEDIMSQTMVQDVVYLLEQFGAPLGYRYKWEVFGPFSEELSDEVYGLSREAIAAADPSASDITGAIVDQVTGVMSASDEANLSLPDWLHLVVSVDFVESRFPGTTSNGNMPPFLQINYDLEVIATAREAAQTFRHALVR